MQKRDYGGLPPAANGEQKPVGSMKKKIKDVISFIIYDKTDVYVEAAESPEYPEKIGETRSNIKIRTPRVRKIFTGHTPLPVREQTKIINSSRCDILNKKIDEAMAEIFDSMKNQTASEYTRVYKKTASSASPTITATSPPQSPKPRAVDTKKLYKYIQSPRVAPKKTADSTHTENRRFIPNMAKLSPDDLTYRQNFRSWLKRICVFAFSIAAGALYMPFGMNPLGLALICAADKYIAYIFAGIVCSLVFIPQNAPLFFLVYAVCAALKFYIRYSREKSKNDMLAESGSFRRLKKRDKLRLLNAVRFNDGNLLILSLLLCAVAGCFIGIADIITAGGILRYTVIIEIMLFILVAMLFCYMYSGLFDAGKDNKTLSSAGVCAVIFTVAQLLSAVNLLTLNAGYIFSFVVTLAAASISSGASLSLRIKGNAENDKNTSDTDSDIINRFTSDLVSRDGTISSMTRGALIGFLCGIALGDPAGAVILGINGFISGIFFTQSATLAIISGFISAVSYIVYIGGIPALQLYIPNMIIGLTLFVPASIIVSNTIYRDAGESTTDSTPYIERGLMLTDLPAARLNSLSEAFGTLSSTFFELAEKLKKPSASEIRAMTHLAGEEMCCMCELHQTCAANKQELYSSAAIKKTTDILIKNDRLAMKSIESNFPSCPSLEDYCRRVNSLYSARLEENIKNDRVKSFAAHYKNVSDLLEDALESGRKEIKFKEKLSEKVYMRLRSMGVDSENVIVMGDREKCVYIFGIKMSDYLGTIGDIISELEKICGVRFGEPEYILKESYVIMKVKCREKFRITPTYLSRAADSDDDKSEREPINGDSVSVFTGDAGYYYGIVSDGMGSGRNAALASKLTVLLTENLLAGGNKKDLTLEMLNSILLSKSDECFATVDLFEADLINGTAAFVKAGAAPSFIVRGGKLFKIQSQTVPAGIIDHLDSEQSKFTLEDGDFVVMLSDGIISSFEEGSWLFELITRAENINNPKKLAALILNGAKQRSTRRDDMSVLCMNISLQP